MSNAEQDLANVAAQYQSTVGVILMAHLAETLENAIEMLGGEEAPEYIGITWVIGTLDEAIKSVAESTY